MLYVTSAAKHLAPMPLGSYTLRAFKDGELFVKIHDDVQGKDVWVIASTESPGDNYLELFFLLSALQGAGAKLNLIISYLGYARQDKPKLGESASLKVVTNFLKQFKIEESFIIHPHTEHITDLISCIPVLPVELFVPILKEFEIIIIPDEGAVRWASDIAAQAGKPTVLMEKKREIVDDVEVKKMVGEVKNKRCIIIDDIIATGNTLIKEAEFLKKHGAKEVSALATHGIMVPDAVEKIQESTLKKVYITNSTTRAHSANGIEVLDLKPVIKKIIEKG